MPVTIDITKDLRYRQGKEDERAEIEKMFMHGLSITVVQNVTDLPSDKLEEIIRKIITFKE